MFEEVENNIEYKYFSCVSLLIPASIMEFIKQIDFLKEFPNSKIPEYDKIASRFKLAKEYFDNKLIEYKNLVYRREIKKHG